MTRSQFLSRVFLVAMGEFPGADINLRDPKHTALWFAKWQNHKEVAAYLESTGAK